MKPRAILCLLAALALLLPGCAAHSGGLSEELLPLGEEAPPVPAPSEGTLGSLEAMESLGGWMVLWEELPEEGFASYVAALEAAGWTSLHAAGNEASTGALLEKGDVTLSLAYSEPSMTMLVLPDGADLTGAIPGEVFPLDDVPAE